MATDKLFTVAGTSKLDGEMKVRFANDVLRIKVLAKHGHEDITLVELDSPVTKYEGITKIKSMGEFANASAQAAITEYLEDKAPKATKVTAKKEAKPKTKTGAATVKTAVQSEATAVAKVEADLEDAPY